MATAPSGLTHPRKVMKSKKKLTQVDADAMAQNDPAGGRNKRQSPVRMVHAQRPLATGVPVFPPRLPPRGKFPTSVAEPHPGKQVSACQRLVILIHRLELSTTL